MNKSFVILLLCAFIGVNGFANDIKPATLNDALNELDKAITKKDVYIQKRLGRIDSIRLIAEKAPKQSLPSLYEQIGDEYRRCNIDSALSYYKKGILVAQNISDSISKQKLELSYVAILPVKGVVKEAVDTYDSIAQNIYLQNKEHFYEVGNRLFYFAESFYPENRLNSYYTPRIQQATDSLIKMLDKSSFDMRLYQAQSYNKKGNAPLMVAEINEIIDSVPFEDFVYARAVSHLAEYYKTQNGKEDQYLYYLALASLSDLYSGTLEGTALQQLGVALYNNGDINRAYKYLVLSLDNAVESGSRIRALQTAEVYPIIAQTYRQQDLSKLNWLMWLVIALIVALVLIVGSVLFLRKEMRKLNDMKAKLSQANITKDTYISKFLSLSSIYIEKMEEFHRVAKRKLKTNQTADLYKLIESGVMLEEQSQMFYKIFDNAFIHIYPTFVADVNKLLVPEKRFELPENKLNTELRILAFMRLGIDDSEQIARFLGLSLNTIYTYRNKLKSKAKNRETFDTDVLKIGQFS